VKVNFSFKVGSASSYNISEGFANVMNNVQNEVHKSICK